MMRAMRAGFLLFLSAGVLAVSSAGTTTWLPVSKRCVLCGATDRFMAPGSFGSYVYNRPEKYQYVFWPYTATEALYRCSKCNFTCWYWDWDLKGVLPAKKRELNRTLKGIRMGWPSARYTMIPMVERLAAAEKVYKILGSGEEEWCKFYRVLGCHLEKDGRAEAAQAARRKALRIAERQAALRENLGTRKEWFFICGAMKFFLDDFSDAKDIFIQARKLKYRRRTLKPDEEKAINGYLSDLLNEYLKAMENPARRAEIRATGGKDGY